MREYVEELTKEKAEEYLTPLLETYRVAVTATAERYGLRQTEEGYLADGGYDSGIFCLTGRIYSAIYGRAYNACGSDGGS